MSTATIYSSSGDGVVGGGSNTNWSTARGLSTGNTAAAAGSGATYLAGYSSNNAGDAFNWYMYRGFLAFDLSGIPAGSTINSATISLYASGIEYHGGGGTTANNSACLVAGSQASASTLATTDFGSVGSTELSTARLPFSSTFSTSGYKTFTLNASGLAVLAAAIGGSAKFAVRTGYDLDNTQPTSTGYSGGLVYPSEATGTSNDPKIDIDYTPVVTPVSASDSGSGSESASYAVLISTASGGDVGSGVEGTPTIVTGEGKSGSDTASGSDSASVAMITAVKLPVYPSIVAGDTFTGTNGTALSAHTPTGANASGSWTRSYGADSNAELKINGNAIFATYNAATSASCNYRHSQSFADGYIEADFTAFRDGFGFGNGYGTVALRAVAYTGTVTDSFGYNMYRAVFDNGAVNGGTGGLVRLSKLVNGTATTLGTYDTGASWVDGAVHTVRLTCSGTTVSVLVDGVSRISVTDSSLSAAGYPVVAIGTPDGTSTSAGVKIDNVVIASGATSLIDPSDTGTGVDTSGAVIDPTTVTRSASDTATGTDTRTGLIVKIDPVTGAPRSGAATWQAERTIDFASPTPLFPSACKMANGDVIMIMPRMTNHLAGDGELYKITGVDNGDGTVTWRNDLTKIYARQGSTWDVRSGNCSLVPSGPHAGKVVVTVADTNWVVGSLPVNYNSAWPNAKVACFTRILISTDATCTAWTTLATLPPAFPALVAEGVNNDFPECPVVFLPNGDWMVATYSRETHDYIGWYSSAYFRSVNNGANWVHEGFIARANTSNANQHTAYMADEPQLLMLDNGEMICVIRTLEEGRNEAANGYTHHLWRCRNPLDRGMMVWVDEGACTVSQAASRPALIQHSSGMVAHAFRVITSGTSRQGAWRTSNDYGATWGTEKNLDNGTTTSGDSGTGTYSYGAWVELSNGGLIHLYCEDAGSSSSTREARLSVTTTPSTARGVETGRGTDTPAVMRKIVAGGGGWSQSAWVNRSGYGAALLIDEGGSTLGRAYPQGVQLPNGDLRIWYSNWPNSQAYKTSTDHGATWSSRVLLDFWNSSPSLTTGFGGGFCKVRKSRSGAKLHACITYWSLIGDISTYPDGAGWDIVYDGYYASSTDGTNWTTPVLLPKSRLSFLPMDVVELANGDILITGEEVNRGSGAYFRNPGPLQTNTYCSTDGGASFSFLSTVADQAVLGWTSYEPAHDVLIDGSTYGKLVLSTACYPGTFGTYDRHIYTSTNGGRSWTFSQNLGMTENRGGLVAMPDGDFVLTHSASGGSSTEMFVSQDKGESWVGRGDVLSGTSQPASVGAGSYVGNKWIDPFAIDGPGITPNLGVAWGSSSVDDAHGSSFFRTFTRGATAAPVTTPGSGQDTGSGTDTASATVVIGSTTILKSASDTGSGVETATATFPIPKIASDSATGVDASVSIAFTLQKFASDFGTGVDSSGNNTGFVPARYLIRDSYVLVNDPNTSLTVNSPTTYPNIEVRTESPT